MGFRVFLFFHFSKCRNFISSFSSFVVRDWRNSVLLALEISKRKTSYIQVSHHFRFHSFKNQREILLLLKVENSPIYY